MDFLKPTENITILIVLMALIVLIGTCYVYIDWRSTDWNIYVKMKRYVPYINMNFNVLKDLVENTLDVEILHDVPFEVYRKHDTIILRSSNQWLFFRKKGQTEGYFIFGNSQREHRRMLSFVKKLEDKREKLLFLEEQKRLLASNDHSENFYVDMQNELNKII